MRTTEAWVLINKLVKISLPVKGLEQEPSEKASKGSKEENCNYSREGTEDFRRTIFIRWTSTLLFTSALLRNPEKKCSSQPVTCLGWAARLLTAFKIHLKCWEAPGGCQVALMRKTFEEKQPWLLGLRA